MASSPPPTPYITHLRSLAGHQKVLLIFASGCVRDEKGRILMQHRADFGTWGLPGGILEVGESLTECVQRELLEETGLRVVPNRLIGIYSSPDFDVTYPNGDCVHQVTFLFDCAIAGGELTSDGAESLRLEWYFPNNPPPTSAWYQAMLDDIVADLPEVQFCHGSSGKRPPHSTIESLRQSIGHSLFVLPAAEGVVFDQHGRLLLQQRADTSSWCLPGGAMELGERLDQTIEQEVLEETGLVVHAKRVIGVWCSHSPFIFSNGDQVQLVITAFTCRLVGGHLQADGIESSAAQFFHLDSLPPISEFHRRILAAALNANSQAVVGTI